MRDFMTYAEFDGFWEQFRPETPFGREAKDQKVVYGDRAVLARIWDQTDRLMAFLEELAADDIRASRISHHLKRIPRFPEEALPVYDEVEIFQFKKFLHNYKGIHDLLDAELRACFGFEWHSTPFEQRLNLGRQSAESFYVADDYSEILARVREEIRNVDVAIRKARETRANEIRSRWNLAFDGRDFLLVDRTHLGDPRTAAEWLILEPFDDKTYSVRPLRGAEELVLAEQRSRLLSQERAAEEAVLEALSEEARQELPRFRTYRQAIQAFDLALARARMARTHQLVRPDLDGTDVVIEQGRFVPCEEACRSLGMPYTPLDARFGTSVAVIFGSNMGGKTIVLKTVAFLQLCAQTGLHVPARAFRSRIFSHFHYLGEGCVREDAQGLSGFGFEIRQLARAWQTFEEPTLVLFDEFARTTNSHEAEAILSAIIESLASQSQVLALFSTHFRGVFREPRATYLKMQGLDREGLDLQGTGEAPLDERIRTINRHMDHRLVADDPTRTVSDAIAVAGLLGLEPSVARRAFFHFQNAKRTQE